MILKGDYECFNLSNVATNLNNIHPSPSHSTAP